MTRDSLRLEYAYMSSEPIIQLNGLEEMDYVNTFLESTGDEPQCWRTTHSSMYQLWSGCITPDLPSSSTHYQWHALYVAWKLVIPSPNLQQILDSLLREPLSTAQTVYYSWDWKSNKNSQSTVRMTCTCAKKFSSALLMGTPNPNCV